MTTYFKKFVTLIFFGCISTISLSSMHDYHLSITEIEYVEEKQSVQIISKIFLDDFEKVLRDRYDKSIILHRYNEIQGTEEHIKNYMLEKFKININGSSRSIRYIGKEYDNDVILIYLEINEVEGINNLEITNSILFESFEEQKNIIRTKINGQAKSLTLIRENAKGVLNFI